ncbi:MAG: Gldg family protein, partial [Chloroflexi bacterium]|nr:Gldg family protein [Chloroflexota bacterium]
MDEHGKSPKRTPSTWLKSVGQAFADFDWRILAPYTVGLGVVLLVLAGGYYFVRRLFDGYVYAGLVIGVVALLVSALLDPGRVQHWLGSRQARYGSNVLLMSLAFVGIVIVLNFLSYRHNARWDLTENKQFTLAPETLQTLETLPEAAEARAYYTSRTGTSRDELQRMLGQYHEASTKFTFRMIDPEADPAAATADSVTRDGTLVVAMGTRSESISYPTEQDITAALVRLSNPGSRKVYFLTGHGEADPAATEDTALRKASDMLVT